MKQLDQRIILNSLLEVDLKFTNLNDYAIKDMQIYCQTFGASGTYIGRTDFITIYQKVPANGSIIVEDIDMGFVDSQTNSIGCELQTYTNLAPL